MKAKDFLPAIGWGLLILSLSGGKGISLPQEWSDLLSVDKWGHAFFYGVFSILILKGFLKSKPLDSKMLIFSFILASSYGIGMEVMQYSFFPDRYFEVLDIIANIIGSIMGLVLFRKFH